MHLHTWKGKLVLEIVTCTRVSYSLITQYTFNGLSATWADEDSYCVYGCVLSATCADEDSYCVFGCELSAMCHKVRLYAGLLPLGLLFRCLKIYTQRDLQIVEYLVHSTICYIHELGYRHCH